MRAMLRGLCVTDKLAYLPLQSIESINGLIFSRLKQSVPEVGCVRRGEVGGGKPPIFDVAVGEINA